MKYGEKHRLHWIRDFPQGIVAPRRVRIYRRSGHYILQWWDPKEKSNLADRVDGDLVAAITRARQIEERLTHFKASGQIRQRHVGHADLVAAFLRDLGQRADAMDIDPATVRRYQSALNHYLAFCGQPAVIRHFPHTADVNRDFRLKLIAFLAQRQVTPNGRAQTEGRPMQGQHFVLDTVRALYEWAADPERGHQLPEGFRNPFCVAEAKTLLKADPLAEPDVNQAMAVDLIKACDRFQLRLFVPMLLFGLRAAEPCFLFAEYLEGHWLRVPCNSDIGYQTKGRRDKRFPLLDELDAFWQEFRRNHTEGLLYERRSIVEGREKVRFQGASLSDMVAEFRRRCAAAPSLSADKRKRLRDAVFHDAGSLTYDHVQGEFAKLARDLQWPSKATLKDLRHLFATMMMNASMPEPYRRYLMGQSQGRAAIVAYTHLHELERHYVQALRREWLPLLTEINGRIRQLRNGANGATFSS
jgi:hypothetical protein